MGTRVIPQSATPIYVTLSLHGQGLAQYKAKISYGAQREGERKLSELYARLRDAAGHETARCTWMYAVNATATLDRIQSLDEQEDAERYQAEVEQARLSAISRGDFLRPVDPAEAARMRHDALGNLSAHSARREELQAAIDAEVRLARVAQASWEAIGKALGISRQAAHERFAG